MEKKLSLISIVTFVFLTLALFMLSSCGSKSANTSDSPSGYAPPEEKAEAYVDDAVDDSGLSARSAFETVSVHFAFDSSAISDSQIEILEKKSEYLSENTDVSIIVEGHCDERGTTEYNLSLGDRRAVRVKSFLVNLGIDSSRITTVSYGEERPLASGSNPEAWAKNRRAQFIVD